MFSIDVINISVVDTYATIISQGAGFHKYFEQKRPRQKKLPRRFLFGIRTLSLLDEKIDGIEQRDIKDKKKNDQKGIQHGVAADEIV